MNTRLFFQKSLLVVSFLVTTFLSYSQSSWVSGTLYLAGDQVIFNSLIFQANSDLTEANKYQDPINNQAVWEVQWVNESEWVSGIQYKVGMVVKKENVLFTPISNISATDAYTEPKNLSAYWELMWTDGEQWLSNLPYNQGDIVLYNTLQYQANQDIIDKGATPFNNCNEWIVLWTNGNTWISGVCYKLGMIVSYNNVEYKAKQDIANTYVDPQSNVSEWTTIWEDGNTWISGLSYDVGAIVTFEGHEYEAKQIR